MKTPPSAGCARLDRCARPPASATRSFRTSRQPLALKDDPFHVRTQDANQVSYWAEFLMPEHAKAMAYYDHPFFGKWPAITENQFGSGTLLYEGTYLSDALQTAVLKEAVEEGRARSGRISNCRRRCMCSTA